MRKYLATVVCGVAGLGVVLLSSSHSAAVASSIRTPHASAARAGRMTFGVPTVVDPIHTWGEPSISLNVPRDELFASGPTGTGTQRSMWEGSVDHGHTFRVIVPGPPAAPYDSEPEPKPGGGDTDINSDRSGKEYFTDLYALACNRSAVTSNGGASTSQSFDACGLYPGADRPWLAVYDPAAGTARKSPYKGRKLIYEEFNNLKGPGPNNGAQWLMSTDGLTWSNATNGETVAGQAIYSPFGNDGYPAIDQETGKVFEAAGYPVGHKFDLRLNIGTPGSSGVLTFLDHPSSPGGGPNYNKLVTVAKDLPGSPDTLFSVLSMDSARNLYLVYCVNATHFKADQVWVTAASAASGWRRWTTPIQVSDGSTKTGDAINVFPWDRAGGPGRVDAVWYGANKSADPSSHSGQKWNVFMNQLVFPVNRHGGITGGRPHMSLVKVTAHPAHYGDICLQGSDCILSQGNRNLADFFSITIDKHGAAEIIYDDTSNGLVQPGGAPGHNQSVDHAGAPLVSIAHQATGMGLYGKPVQETTNAPVSGARDPAGDARFPVIGGQNVAGMDIRDSALALSKDAKTLTVTMKVVNLRNPSATMSRLTGANFLQYVTRWQMGNTLYFAGASTSGGAFSYYAGTTGSIDLCSVSACFPHVLVYPESSPSFAGASTSQPGKLSCPKKPSAGHPCRLTISVTTASVGRPTPHSLLEEVGTYAFAAPAPQSAENNATAARDIVPLEIDGACCFNFRGAVHHHQAHHHHHRRPSRRPRRSRGFTG